MVIMVLAELILPTQESRTHLKRIPLKMRGKIQNLMENEGGRWEQRNSNIALQRKVEGSQRCKSNMAHFNPMGTLIKFTDCVFHCFMFLLCCFSASPILASPAMKLLRLQILHALAHRFKLDFNDSKD
jgi:hypothetical protein